MGDDLEIRCLDLEGGSLNFHVAGEGPVLVLAHALGPVAWGDVTGLASSCTVVIPDFPESTLDLATSASMAWFEPLLASIGQKQGTLCAWSMSGPGAIWFAAEEPESLSKLILVDVAGLGPELPPLELRDLPTLIWMRIVGGPTRGFVRMLWRNWVWQKGFDTRELEDASLRFFRDNPNAFGMPGNDDDEDEDEEEDEELVDDLQYIKVPTLILAGRHSGVLGPDFGEEARKRLPNGELVVFEESSHTLQLEEHNRFVEVVSEFMSRPDEAADA